MKRSVNGWVLGLGALALPGGVGAQEAGEAAPGVTPASVYVGLSSSCAVFSGEWWNAGDVRGTPVRGVCGVPQEAVAVQLEVRSESLGGQSPQVKVWAADAPEPLQGVLEEEFGKAGQARQALALVSLCGGGDCTEGDLLLRSSAQALLEIRVAGYFQPWAAVSGESAEDTTGVSGGGTLTASSGDIVLEPLAGIEQPTNSFFGTGAGVNNTGLSNSFFGADAGNQNITGFANSFFGADAGLANNSDFNSFFGAFTGVNNQSGQSNAFFGAETGANNIGGSFNSFFGNIAGLGNIDGSNNSFFGFAAGVSNTVGNDNTAVGIGAGASNTSGSGNTFIGLEAGFFNTVENFNTALGFYADVVPGITNATAIGAFSQVSQSNSLILGSVAGENFATESVNVGIGVSTPGRQLHLRGSNAAFRMDRDRNSAAFILTRTAREDFDTVWKTYVVGVNASGPGAGEFIINDLGTAVSGGGSRRMTIENTGRVVFNGAVRAQSFQTSSSERFKDDVQTLTGVPEALASLRGVRFAWKESGEPDIGLIAEEVAEVFPELVQRDAETGAVESVNYPALVAVLIEGFKTQQGQLQVQAQHGARQDQQLAAQQQQLALQGHEIAFYQERLAAVERQQDELAHLKTQMTEITDRLLSNNRPVLAQW